eukprot:283959-Prymnesium_polylepis.2
MRSRGPGVICVPVRCGLWDRSSQSFWYTVPSSVCSVIAYVVSLVVVLVMALYSPSPGTGGGAAFRTF